MQRINSKAFGYLQTGLENVKRKFLNYGTEMDYGILIVPTEMEEMLEKSHEGVHIF